MNSTQENGVLALDGIWSEPKHGAKGGTDVPVIVRGFGQAATSGQENRPVAIIEKPDGCLRFVELKYVRIQRKAQ